MIFLFFLLFNWSSGIRGESSVSSCAALIGWRFHQNTIGKSREFIQFRPRSLLINPLITESRAGQALRRDSPEARSDLRRASPSEICARVSTLTRNLSIRLTLERAIDEHTSDRRTSQDKSFSQRSHRIGPLLSTISLLDVWMGAVFESFPSVEVAWKNVLEFCLYLLDGERSERSERSR